MVNVVGRLPRVSPGEYLDAVGTWVTDRAHGRQFKADELRVSPPSTLEGISKYLGSGMIKGVGPHFAQRLVEAFGDEVFDVIENHPQRLLKVRGIGRERQARILDAWNDQKAIREIMVFLHSHGVGTARAVRIYKTYGSDALKVVRRNPFRLARDIPGIGFRSADEIAGRLGIEPDSPLRIAAGLLFVLQELGGDGHCAATTETWRLRTAELLRVSLDSVIRVSQSVIDSGEVTLDRVDDEELAYLTDVYRAENDLARRLVELLSAPPMLPDINVEKAIEWVEPQVGMKLAPSQKAALGRAVRAKVVVITGGPGVGKTTLVFSLLTILRAKRLQCLLCAPTGRAARRLADTTNGEAKTIHRLLEYNPGSGFRYNENRKLECDVLILDEASMVDVVLMEQLVRALPSTASLVIVGDVDQLPSVGPGQVLRDCIDSGAIPMVRLTEIFRQSAASRIVTNAHRMNEGELPDTKYDPEELGDFYFVEANEPQEVVDRTCTLVKDRIPKRFGLDPIRDVQVLTPMKRSILGSDALNRTLQEILNPESGPQLTRFGWHFRQRDKVMQIENNYDREVFNGDVGVVVAVDQEEGTLEIDFEGRHLVYESGDLDEIVPAYACSIHKSQGSEYPAVVIPVHTQHYMLLYRNVLYTGVTRAKKLVILVGSVRALGMAVERTDQMQRVTGLRSRLRRRAADTGR